MSGRGDRQGIGPRPSGPVDPGLFPITVDHRWSRTACRSAGADLVDLAEEFGTPLFVYDEAHLRARCREAVEAWGDGVAYATKAFLCMAMARLAHEEGMCLDVSTGGELHVALAAGVPPDRLVLHGNNKSDEELAAALAVGVGRIVVDSFDEIDRLERLVPEIPVVEDRVEAARHDVAPRSWPGSPRASRPTPTSSSGPARTTPSSASGWPRGPPPRPSTGSPSSTAPGRSSSSASTPTSAARSSPWPPSSRPSRCWPGSSLRSACPSWWSAAASAWPT